MHIKGLWAFMHTHSPTDSPTFGFKSLDLGSIASLSNLRVMAPQACALELELNRQRLTPAGEGGAIARDGGYCIALLEEESGLLSVSPPWLLLTGSCEPSP